CRHPHTAHRSALARQPRAVQENDAEIRNPAPRPPGRCGQYGSVPGLGCQQLGHRPDLPGQRRLLLRGLRSGTEGAHSMSAEEQAILTERRGPILVVTINRPQARNAFNSTAAMQMNAAMDLLEEDDSLFMGVITGAGGTFCAGQDL